jgi:hypothetical protein
MFALQVRLRANGRHEPWSNIEVRSLQSGASPAPNPGPAIGEPKAANPRVRGPPTPLTRAAAVMSCKGEIVALEGGAFQVHSLPAADAGTRPPTVLAASSRSRTAPACPPPALWHVLSTSLSTLTNNPAGAVSPRRETELGVAAALCGGGPPGL